jgi:hypothetical protein
MEQEGERGEGECRREEVNFLTSTFPSLTHLRKQEKRKTKPLLGMEGQKSKMVASYMPRTRLVV